MQPVPFGKLGDGRETSCFTLRSAQLRVRVTDYGARLVAIEMPDRDGVWGDVLLGFDDARSYAAAGGSFGAVLGRYANRIGGGRFTLDGRQYQLAVNDAGNTLHGGPQGFGAALWRVQAYRPEAGELVLTHVSPDGDQGFPGELCVQAAYRLSGGALSLVLTATTDRATIVNLSSHPYFNLAGAASGDCLGHEICIAADRFVVTDASQIPTGVLRPVQGTAFDFRLAKQMDAGIRARDDQLLIGKGYDHCFVLGFCNDVGGRFAASAFDKHSGRMLTLFSDRPGLQFYSGNSLDGSIAGRNGVIYRQSAGFAFEAENFPDAPNHPEFPSSILRPGEVFSTSIRYEFSVR